MNHLAVPSWDEYYIAMLQIIPARSKDPRCKVGAIVVDQSNKVVSTGYNGFPSGVTDWLPERWEAGEKDYWIIHAEENALFTGGHDCKGGTMYCSFFPCARCARAICQFGIDCLVVDRAAHNARMTPKWEEDMKRAKLMLEEKRIDVIWYGE